MFRQAYDPLFVLCAGDAKISMYMHDDKYNVNYFITMESYRYSCLHVCPQRGIKRLVNNALNPLLAVQK